MRSYTFYLIKSNKSQNYAVCNKCAPYKHNKAHNRCDNAKCAKHNRLLYGCVLVYDGL